MFENPLYLVGLIVLAIILVVLILKSISIIFKLLIIIAVAGIMYVLYGSYPAEVMTAGVVLLGLYFLVRSFKSIFKKK